MSCNLKIIAGIALIFCTYLFGARFNSCAKLYQIGNGEVGSTGSLDME